MTFQSFRSTQNGWVRGENAGRFAVLEDPFTGAPVGLQSPRANGPQGIWAPIQLTAAQIASPTAAILADLNATYQLNVAPYTRYYSDGVALVSSAASGGFVTNILTADPPGFNDGQYVATTSTIAATDTSLVVADAIFAPDDVGKAIGVLGAGTAGAYLSTTIASYVSPTNIILTDAAITTLSATGNKIRWGTDNTTAIQTLVTSMAASGLGGVIYFPDGLYMVNGPFQDFPSDAGAVGKSIILIPDHGPTVGPITITFEGQTPPNYGGFSVIGGQSVSMAGSIIMTTKGDASGAPSIIGGAGNTIGYYFTNVTLGVKNLTFRTYNNPFIMCVDAQYITGLQAENLTFDVGTSPTDYVLPQGGNAIALATPLNLNGAYTYVRNINVTGYYVGVQYNEHCNADNVNVYNTRVAHYVNTAGHAMKFGRLTSQDCTIDLQFQHFGGVAAVTIQCLDIEVVRTTAFASISNIDDPNNAGYGEINWHVVEANVGQINDLTVNGGGHLKLQQIISNATPMGTVEGPNGLFGTMIAYSPVTATTAQPITVRGTVSVRSLPA